MKIVVIGGSGLIGSKLVHRLIGTDHTIISASPTSGINTITREGLHEVMKDTDVVVDVSNAPSLQSKVVLDFFRRSTMNLLTAALYAGVKHHIVLSVVGANRLPASSYMRAKLAQEEMIMDSGIPYSILRSTQFFELAERIAAAGTIGEEVHISSAAFQPVAADEAVNVLAEMVTAAALNNSIEVAGPVLMPMYEFIRFYMDATEDPRQLIGDEHALYLGTELNDDSLLPGENPRLGKIKYEDWFKAHLVEQ
jgi:uncharacterized protein YbjT (DUF2867 family)